jgi:hypothetical protein
MGVHCAVARRSFILSQVVFSQIKNKISNRINAIAGSHVGAAEAELLLCGRKAITVSPALAEGESLHHWRCSTTSSATSWSAI